MVGQVDGVGLGTVNCHEAGHLNWPWQGRAGLDYHSEGDLGVSHCQAGNMVNKNIDPRLTYSFIQKTACMAT